MRQHERRQSFLELIEPDPGSSFHCLVREAPQGFRFNWHHHPELELTWIIRGSGLRFVGDAIEEFNTGDLVLLGPNLPHTWASRDERKPARAMVVQILPPILAPMLASPELRRLQPLLEAAELGLMPTLTLRKRLHPAMHALAQMPSSDPRRLLALLEILLTLSQGKWRTLSTPGYRTQATGPAGVRLRKVLDRVQFNLGQTDSAADLARLVGMTPQGFSRFFHRQVGCTFVTYLNRWRISLACQSLFETDVPITKIAYRVGFTNLSNFHRRFRQIKGITPADYRRQARAAARHSDIG